MLSLCDTSASVFGRLFGRYTPRLPFAGSLFGAKKSLAGTLAAVAVGMTASYYFWTRFAAIGDEGDVSWLQARMASAWRGRLNPDPLGAWGIKRLPNPQRCARVLCCYGRRAVSAVLSSGLARTAGLTTLALQHARSPYARHRQWLDCRPRRGECAFPLTFACSVGRLAGKRQACGLLNTRADLSCS